MIYYYMTYQWKSHLMSNYEHVDCVTDKHPISIISDLRTKYSEGDSVGLKMHYEYQLLFYTEISREDFLKYKEDPVIGAK